MSSFDDWDDDDGHDNGPRSPRRRSRTGDDIRLREGQTPQSGAVTGAGVISIIMGVLFLLCGIGMGFCGVVFTGMGQAVRQGGAIMPPGWFEVTGGVLLGIALLYLILGIGNLIAGIVTLQRRNWGRVFALILGAMSALFGLFQIFLIVVGLTQDGGLFGGAGAEERAVQAVTNGFIAIIFFGHAIFVYIVLLNSHNKEEFE